MDEQQEKIEKQTRENKDKMDKKKIRLMKKWGMTEQEYNNWIEREKNRKEDETLNKEQLMKKYPHMTDAECECFMKNIEEEKLTHCMFCGMIRDNEGFDINKKKKLWVCKYCIKKLAYRVSDFNFELCKILDKNNNSKDLEKFALKTQEKFDFETDEWK